MLVAGVAQVFKLKDIGSCLLGLIVQIIKFPVHFKDVLSLTTKLVLTFTLAEAKNNGGGYND